MSFFPRSYLTNETSSFTPLFRLLDDFDQYNRGGSHNGHHSRHSLKSFTPRFDVKELDKAYELHGELPGIEQKDVEIEFVDEQTLTIRGRTERSYTSGTPPAGIEGAPTAGRITEAESAEHHKAHQPTVEDENAEAAGTSSEVTKPEKADKKSEVQAQTPQEKFWVSERSVGEFSRSFSFPVRVDQDQVKASMKNGILSIVVPKAKKQESRRINIE